MTLTEYLQSGKFEEMKTFFGITCEPVDLDFCDDGSVYYGLTQVEPKNTIEVI